MAVVMTMDRYFRQTNNKDDSYKDCEIGTNGAQSNKREK